MREVTQEQIVDALQLIGIQQGDGLLVHSAIHYLGRPVHGVGTYLDALNEVIGPVGTLAVPTFNFAFAKGERYDYQETPSAGMGAFSEFIRQQPTARRTTHPLQSLAILGNSAEELAAPDTQSAFDPGSAFERLLELDFKILLLGADINAISLLHYSEQRAEVPYRYWKDFTGDVKSDNAWITRTYRMYVRDLDIDPQIDLQPVQERLQDRGEWHSMPLNYGFVSQCRAVAFVSAVDQFLTNDPWSLVMNR